MNQSILITGVAGTGKTTICNELAKRGYQAFSIEDIDGLYSRLDKRTGQPFKDYDANNLEDVKQSSWFCNQKKLKDFMSQYQEGTVFYGGVASNLDDIRPLFNRIFLLETSPEILRQRLIDRTTNVIGKAEEVRKWLFSHKDAWEAHMKIGATAINNDRNLETVVAKIIEKSQESFDL